MNIKEKKERKKGKQFQEDHKNIYSELRKDSKKAGKEKN